MAEQRSVREVSRQAIRGHIEAVAMELFLDQGVDATTVDQIATGAGISPRTFFRYFPTKEDVVLGDPLEHGVVLRDMLESRPATEDAAQAMDAAMHEFVDGVIADPGALGISTLVLSTPTLRAKHIEKQHVWVDLLMPDVRRRLGEIPHAELLARSIISIAMSAFDTSLVYWAAGGGRDDLHDLVTMATGAPTRTA